MIRIADFIGIIITVVLSALWVDIRRVARNRQKDENERLRREAAFKEYLFQTFLTQASHDEQCAKNLARIETSVLNMKVEILTELRNGKKK